MSVVDFCLASIVLVDNFKDCIHACRGLDRNLLKLAMITRIMMVTTFWTPRYPNPCGCLSHNQQRSNH